MIVPRNFHIVRANSTVWNESGAILLKMKWIGLRVNWVLSCTHHDAINKVGAKVATQPNCRSNTVRAEVYPWPTAATTVSQARNNESTLSNRLFCPKIAYTNNSKIKHLYQIISWEERTANHQDTFHYKDERQCEEAFIYDEPPTNSMRESMFIMVIGRKEEQWPI